MADPRPAGHLAQRQGTDALLHQDLAAGLDQRILQIAVVIAALQHVPMLSHNLDNVKILY